ncbi:MAG: GNAT family N-acetyltransferase [Saprospiraceae bacterium]
MMQNTHFNFQIKKGSIEDVVTVSNQIPELENPHAKEVYKTRMNGKKHLILIAYLEKEMIGFKVGYDKFEDGKNFYTWMGGILPAFRKKGIAAMLAKKQETWIKQNGFQNVILKTRNKHQGMLIFAIKNNFKIIEIEPKENINEHRILLKKELNVER